jgi:hypothetical protein
VSEQPSNAEIMDALAETRAALDRVEQQLVVLAPLFDETLRCLMAVLYASGAARRGSPFSLAAVLDVLATKGEG